MRNFDPSSKLTLGADASVVRSGWVKEQHVRLEADKIVEYQVNLAITFVLDN